jgi:endonuclease YncB( thermonuclease family)
MGEVLRFRQQTDRFRRRPKRRNFVLPFALLLLIVYALLEREPTHSTVEPSRIRYTAIDGDSLRSSGEDIRLIGIDAPELFQTCRNSSGREWACGQAAYAHLSSLVAGNEVRCSSSSKDRYGRALARCSVGTVADLGEEMVREGLAVDFMNGGYGRAEAEARAAGRGMWAGSFEPPQEWRRLNPR